jgi:hypothetical protein
MVTACIYGISNAVNFERGDGQCRSKILIVIKQLSQQRLFHVLHGRFVGLDQTRLVFVDRPVLVRIHHGEV